MKQPKAFFSYLENEDKLNLLTDEEAGRLYKLLYAYARTGEVPDFGEDRLLQFAFKDFAADIDRDQERYAETCKKRAEAGKKGGEAKAKNYVANEANVNSDVANLANAKNGVAKCSKSSETEIETETENNILSNDNIFSRAKEIVDFNVQANEVIKTYNRICADLPKVEKLTGFRKSLIFQAIRDSTDFEALFKKVQASDFLCHREGDFKACGIDWILNEKNRTKILEGTYDNKGKPKKKRDGFHFESDSYDINEYEKKCDAFWDNYEGG